MYSGTEGPLAGYNFLTVGVCHHARMDLDAGTYPLHFHRRHRHLRLHQPGVGGAAEGSGYRPQTAPGGGGNPQGSPLSS
ncbi:uncharacterized protein LOC144625354 isoform X2 [Crassostrea virginica]